ncbi:class I SAM-dependent methyltransferase [Sphingosinicella humi]|uniref:SAM-dependent methyltransferase n=1 Tax=Allosphingosinicella humi TaxID=2068657 RepID=A0A2U2J4V3_9SPHN|nr:class I SAM-dependent methyltransferase [Sphingosinicella humi]PWG03383.1 SAM-dependent methyltransferase [Sphingosinicella humi]
MAHGYDAATLRFYADEAPVYVSSGPGGISRHLIGFLDRLEPGASILELGCGGGRDAEWMLAQGFDVDPTDGVLEMAAKAEARVGRPVRLMRFDEIDVIGRYDAVWANASLLHVPRSGLPAILTSVMRALKPGGLHFASYKGGGAEGRDRFGRYFNYLSLDDMLKAYRRSGDWRIISTVEYEGGGYEGGNGPWVAITAAAPE